ncbi:MAG: hypothetical protein JSV80_16225 [Acidobacteriota bacterium]|nr:MAG: hypothetical protein JSV80_16225 [Acidobacteriota bacterium]
MRSLIYMAEATRVVFSDLLRRPLVSLLSLVTMTAAVLVLAVFLMLMRGVQQTVDRWVDQAVVEVYLTPVTTEQQAADLRELISSYPSVRRVEWVSSQESLAQFRLLFPDVRDIDLLLGENPFPASLRIVPATFDARAVAELISAVDSEPSVTGIRYDRDWLEAMARVGQAAGWLLLGGAGLLLLSALVAVGSVVRLALDDKREEVALMRLTGAPALYVISPVLLAGALLGGTGALLAAVLAHGGQDLLMAATAGGPLSGWVQALFGSGLSFGSAVLLVLAGTLAGSVSAALTAGRATFR